MSDEVLEAAIRCTFNSSFVKPNGVNDTLKILWHAGEPLTVPIRHYQKAIELIEHYNQDNISCFYSVQTNATLINQKWCDFLKANQFEVVVSVDGPEFINDRHRRNWSDKGSFAKIMKGIDCLVSNDMPLLAIAVLTDYSLDYADEIFHFFKQTGFISVGFNIDEAEGTNQKSSFDNGSSMTPQRSIIQRYQAFMQRIYDLWIQDGRTIRIREFENALSLLSIRRSGYTDPLPHKGSIAFALVSIARDGSITTFSPELASGTSSNPHYFAIGNVTEIKSLDECLENANFQQQLKEVGLGIQYCAESCEYFDFCGGGCPSNKFYERGTFATTDTIYCNLSIKTMMDLMINNLSSAKR